ncbi:MAG: ABC transporter substrate-binding protein [Azospirillum sp.]|nr:ABC transporter substrate-binding protein [Azospirillum sp.]
MMIRRFSLLCVALLAICGGAGLSQPAFAVDLQAGAGPFINSLARETIESLATKGLAKDEVRRQFRALLTQNFDIPRIGRFVLGNFWNDATPAQQQEYLKLFEALIVEIYADRFSQYSGETLKIESSRVEGKDAFVSTQIQRPNGPPVNVEWRVRARDNGALSIIDVIVENVSMSVTQRSEFKSVILSRGGKVEGLLEALREKRYASP